MKKFFAVLLTGLMAISIAACSNNNTGTVSQESKLTEITKTDNTKEDYLTDTKLYKSFFSKMSDDEFSLKLNGDMDINGSTVSMEMEMQKQGDKKYGCVKVLGMDMVSIQKDGYTYTLNSMTKTYTKTKIDESSSDQINDTFKDMTGSLKELKFIENGVSNEEGTTDYEKYAPADSTTDSVMTCYFNGDEIKYIDTQTATASSDASTESSADSSSESSAGSQKVRMGITLTSSIDASLFEIPEGYTEQSSDDTLEQVSGIDDISLADGVSLIEDPEE